MTVPILRALALAAIALLPARTHAQTAPPRDSLALAQQYTRWFYTGRADSLFAHFGGGMRDQSSTKDIEQQLAQLTVRAGFEEKLIDEKFVKRNGATQYWRTAKFSLMEEPLLIRWALNA